jgi:hypothetical protein
LKEYALGEKTVLDVQAMINTRVQARATEKNDEVPDCKDAIIKGLQAALETGDVGPRTPIGQRFASYLKANPEKQTEYLGFKGKTRVHDLKKAFRLEWAKIEVEARIEIVKQKTTSHTTVQGHKGIYKTLDRMIMDEGGFDNPLAVERSINYAMEATSRGFPYVEWNAWKKATEILVMDKIYDSTHSTDESIIRRESGDVAAGAVLDVATPAKNNERPGKKPRLALAATSAGGPAPEASPDDKKAKAMVQKEATELKSKYLSVTALHAITMRNIRSDSKYEWANNPVQTDRFDKVMNKLNEKINEHSFNVVFTGSDLPGVKAEFGDDLSTHFARFLDTKSAIDDMEAAQTRFNKMHIANL